ncbi:UDP-glucuronosyltransferase 1-2-like isoform X2 [Branchiostoma floridae x Branchiostoma belcheri]
MRGDPYCLDEVATGVPLPMSYVPYLGTDFTDDMSFTQRLQNAVLYTVVPVLSRRVAGSLYDELGRKYVGEEETIQSVTSRTDLWLYQTDKLLDYPRPIMPNMVQVGGLNVRVAAPLTKDMEAFVQSSWDDGVIVVSFGSMVKTMSRDKRESSRRPSPDSDRRWCGVTWERSRPGWATTPSCWTGCLRTTYWPTQRPEPLSPTPGRAECTRPCTTACPWSAWGLGVTLDFSTVTADQLYQAILHVLTNSSYRETAARLSRLHRDQPQSPMERAVWWIEHVIQHSRLPHLRARAAELPWYQYYLLDVAAFLLSVCSAVLGTVWCGCSLICRRCCAKGGGKLKSQ